MVVGGDTYVVALLHFPKYSTNASPAPPAQKLASKGTKIIVDVDDMAVSPSATGQGPESGELTPEDKERARKAAKLQAMAARVAALRKKGGKKA